MFSQTMALRSFSQPYFIFEPQNSAKYSMIFGFSPVDVHR